MKFSQGNSWANGVIVCAYVNWSNYTDTWVDVYENGKCGKKTVNWKLNEKSHANNIIELDLVYKSDLKSPLQIHHYVVNTIATEKNNSKHFAVL